MMSMNTAKDFCNYTFSTYRWPRVCSKNNCHCDWTSSWKCPHRIISDFSFVRKDMYQIQFYSILTKKALPKTMHT